MHSRDVQKYLQNRLITEHSRFHWSVEHTVAGTPVDVVGENEDTLVCIELEWRRADPTNNTAKLFRHLSNETLTATIVIFCQLFSDYYDLKSGGVSSKRLNAEFVGQTASDTLPGLSYHSIEFAMDPPKRNAVRPKNWQAVADDTAVAISRVL